MTLTKNNLYQIVAMNHSPYVKTVSLKKLLSSSALQLILLTFIMSSRNNDMFFKSLMLTGDAVILFEHVRDIILAHIA